MNINSYSDWINCLDPQELLNCLFIDLKQPCSFRKARLFGCACWRSRWAQLTDDCKAAVLVAERLADGQANTDEPVAAELNLDQPGINPAVRAGLRWLLNITDHPYTIASNTALYCYGFELDGQSAHVASMIREIWGNPFREVRLDPQWQTSTVLHMAQACYEHRNIHLLPILADALSDAGCTNIDLLAHLRSEGIHNYGCWALDIVLEKS